MSAHGSLLARLTETTSDHGVSCPNGDALVAVLTYCDGCGAMGRRTVKEQEARERCATALRRSLSADARVRMFRGSDASVMGAAAELAWEDAKEALLALEQVIGWERMGVAAGMTPEQRRRIREEIERATGDVEWVRPETRSLDEEVTRALAEEVRRRTTAKEYGRRTT